MIDRTELQRAAPRRALGGLALAGLLALGAIGRVCRWRAWPRTTSRSS